MWKFKKKNAEKKQNKCKINKFKKWHLSYNHVMYKAEFDRNISGQFFTFVKYNQKYFHSKIKWINMECSTIIKHFKRSLITIREHIKYTKTIDIF